SSLYLIIYNKLKNIVDTFTQLNGLDLIQLHLGVQTHFVGQLWLSSLHLGVQTQFVGQLMPDSTHRGVQIEYTTSLASYTVS
ncbi:hypothetical protein WMO40_22440, partial [Bacillaceae bacterium CLA-AA-H227]